MNSTEKLRQILATSWRSQHTGPFFKTTASLETVRSALPGDYLAVIGEFGGREGFLGESYVRLYRLEELLDLNIAYDVPKRLPGVMIFGSDGCGSAYAFVLGKSDVACVPFIPLCAELVRQKAASFSVFVDSLVNSGASNESNQIAFGKEVHEVHPIAFGGDPVSETNKVLVSPREHADLCRFWSEKYVDIRSRART